MDNANENISELEDRMKESILTKAHKENKLGTRNRALVNCVTTSSNLTYVTEVPEREEREIRQIYLKK